MGRMLRPSARSRRPMLRSALRDHQQHHKGGLRWHWLPYRDRERFNRVTQTKRWSFRMHTPKNERNHSMRIQRTALVIASAAALTACGAATSSPTGSPTSAPTVSPTSSPTPTSSSVVGTPSPTPTHTSFEPLFVAFGDNQIAGGGTLGSGKAVLMLANGTITAPMPSGPIIDGDATLAISGTFGARMIGIDGQQIGSNGAVSIVAGIGRRHPHDARGERRGCSVSDRTRRWPGMGLGGANQYARLRIVNSSDTRHIHR